MIKKRVQLQSIINDTRHELRGLIHEKESTDNNISMYITFGNYHNFFHWHVWQKTV